MQDPKKMSTKQLLTWLRKTSESFCNAYYREGYEGYKANGYLKLHIGAILCRYEDLRHEAMERSNGLIWAFYCNETGAAKSHDAYDMLA